MKIFNKEYLKKIWKVLMATFSGFINDNGLKLSASLAYYTIFSIAPLLILVLALTGIFLKDKTHTDEFYTQITHYVGSGAADQIKSIVKTQGLVGKRGFGLIIGLGVLLLGASSMFVEIQDSLNIIWRVKAKPKKGWLKLIQNRFLSFSLIVSLGFLLLVSLIINFIINLLSAQIERIILFIVRSENLSHFISGSLLYAANFVITLIIITVLFAIIFKVLPDVKIKWRDVRMGAFFTALLFMLGQYLIGLYIQYFANSSAYGAAGSIIVILTWIYYTSSILYIGAEFTQVYAEAIGSQIEPADYAVHVQQTEVERVVEKLPAQNPDIKGKLKKD